MISSRLYYTAMMLFWVCYLSLLALVVTYAPQGGLELAGLALFADSGLVETALAAMTNIGLSQLAQSVVLGLLGGFSLASAGLILFAVLFCVFGREREQREARSLAEGAVVCTAAASVLISAISFAGGQAGALLVLQFSALGGLVLTLMSLSQSPIVPDNSGDDAVSDLDQVISDHAANHAAFSAQLASFAKGGGR
ncbi:hypothetical protein PZ897_02720 [Hoeflea sp. YIM 152468]|uniref:hypothetical protein n=1 Tax=Hoeflea sp. YIM 152468 TaxID=3031759 RepID=UPI0023DCB9A0|nr:hypothetical protein [Hoeflea sp. YIM 152468]MDF1607081.1 hypothetical protein [Hoeflea sp. YIM 152468]